jgi:hypothetical protein
MNSHLNIFKTYTNSSRTFQLENDLTRAFAICLQEDSLFFHEILKEILNPKFYSQLFDSLENDATISIDIQKKASQITDYEHIFAVTLSEAAIRNFWEVENNRDYDPICDLVIRLNNIYLVIEAKRDNFDCTAQLYNQILNIININEDKVKSLNENEHKNLITPYDLNWSKLMIIAVRVLSFEKSFGNPNRFLSDFVSLVKNHNFRWLPEAPINSLKFNNRNSILRRIDSAIIEASKSNRNISKLTYNDRLGIHFSKGWAQEILFNIDENGDLIIAIYPGNTKAQGLHLFRTNHFFNQNIELLNEKHEIVKKYHIKLTSFQKYFTGIDFYDKELKENLYTTNNFNKFTGRKKRGKEWNEIEILFDNSFNFDWKKQCNWNEKVVNSGRNQFDLSFGYEICLKIPFKKLKEIDNKPSDLNNLTGLIEDVYRKYSDNLLNTIA